MITWKRIPTLCRAHQIMLVDGVRNGWWIHAVQHPTALRPYEVVQPNGEALPGKYSLLVDAKAALLAAIEEASSHDQD